MRKLFIALSAIGFLVSAIWFYKNPGFDSGVAAITTLAALISSLLTGSVKLLKKQSQKVSGKSVSVQGGRDVSVGEINNK